MAQAPNTAVALSEPGSTAPTLTQFEVIERVITSGDLSQMTAQDRVAFYWRTCESLGLNPMTRPFEFISLNGKLTMYARKDATDQLRKINAVSVTNIRREKDDALGLLTVYAAGRDKSGREDEATGVVSIKGLGGEALANAVMKAETKAKRRLTLSLVGLGFLDESEVDDRGDVTVDPETGEIQQRPQPKSLLESVQAQQEAMAAPGPEAAKDAPEPLDVVEDRSPEQQRQDGDAPAATPDAEEGEAREVPAPLAKDAFMAALAEHRIAPDYAMARSREMFPRGERTALTDDQRGALLADLIAPESDAATQAL